jgi:Ca2+ transporting ATPase
MGQHLMILYVPFFHGVFGVVPLDASEWALVLFVSLPVVLLDEVLKLITRMRDPSRRSVGVSRAAQSIGHGEKAV